MEKPGSVLNFTPATVCVTSLAWFGAWASRIGPRPRMATSATHMRNNCLFIWNSRDLERASRLGRVCGISPPQGVGEAPPDSNR